MFSKENTPFFYNKQAMSAMGERKSADQMASFNRFRFSGEYSTSLEYALAFCICCSGVRVPVLARGSWASRAITNVAITEGNTPPSISPYTAAGRK